MSDKSNAHLEPVEAAASDDPFDLSKLRVSQDFLETTNVKKLLTTVPIRKPGPQDFLRVHSSPRYECFIATLFTAITRTGVLFMWPVRVPAADGRVNGWHQSAATAAQHAMKSWIRIKANMGLGAYEIFEAEGSIPDPDWPDLSFEEIYRIAFKDRLIADPDHPVIKRLRGG
jgi:hypothetical protein